jgi:hypothetical protein
MKKCEIEYCDKPRSAKIRVKSGDIKVTWNVCNTHAGQVGIILCSHFETRVQMNYEGQWF